MDLLVMEFFYLKIVLEQNLQTFRFFSISTVPSQHSKKTVSLGKNSDFDFFDVSRYHDL